MLLNGLMQNRLHNGCKLHLKGDEDEDGCQVQSMEVLLCSCGSSTIDLATSDLELAAPRAPPGPQTDARKQDFHRLHRSFNLPVT